MICGFDLRFRPTHPPLMARCREVLGSGPVPQSSLWTRIKHPLQFWINELPSDVKKHCTCIHSEAPVTVLLLLLLLPNALLNRVAWSWTRRGFHHQRNKE